MQVRMGHVLIFASLAVLFFLSDIQAMPNFARRYSLECSVCHTVVPKLNRQGYEFRLAGYRMPADIGKEDNPEKLNDFFSARLQEQYLGQKHDDVNSAKNTTTNQLEFHEATVYPLTGAWGKYFASLVELSMAPDDVFEVENAFVRFTYGNKNGFLSARVGIVHPWEGVGASDRPVGNGRPLIQKSTAIGSPFFLWNLDESAAELAYYFAKSGTTLSARVSNGILWKENGSGTAEAAQGGGLRKPRSDPGFNDKSFQVFLNQFFAGESSLGFYYYRGTVPFPDPNYASTTTTTLDTFHRLAFYGNVWAVKERLNLLGGYEYGKDTLDDPKVASSDGKYNGAKVGKSNGWFAEADYHPKPEFAIGTRFDGFDASDKVAHNDQWAFALFANYRFYRGLQFIADYQRKITDQSAGGSNTDHQFIGRLIFIF